MRPHYPLAPWRRLLARSWQAVTKNSQGLIQGTAELVDGQAEYIRDLGAWLETPEKVHPCNGAVSLHGFEVVNWLIEGSKGGITYSNDEILLHRVPLLYEREKVEKVEMIQHKKSGHDYVIEDFITAVAQGKKPETDISDTIQSMAMVFGAIEAVKQNTRVKVPA